jgi:hypothetical protein
MKKKIFISSVQKEFSNERKLLFDYLHSDSLLGLFFEPFIFENLPATDQKTNTAYLREVSKCDIFIGILGAEYGFEDKNGTSPTELEYQEATRLHKIRLIFIKDTLPSPRHPKMATLIQKIEKQVIRKRFNYEAELLSNVYASLVNYLIEKDIIRSGPFDAAPNRAKFDEIDENAVFEFVARAKIVRNFPLSPTASVKEILTHLNLFHEEELSNAAILLFGKNPQRFIFGSEVKCAHFHGTEVSKPIPSYQTYKGNVFKLVDQSVDFILSKLNIEVGTRGITNQVPTKYEIPRAVVSESIVNAIAHRDYSSTGSVQVMLFSDRMEIWNPGTLASALSLPQLKTHHGSFPVNPLLAEPMYLAGYIERLGTGTRDIINLCLAANLKEPEFSLDDGFRVVIWRPTGGVCGGVSGGVSGEVSGEVQEEIRRIILVSTGDSRRLDLQQKLQLKSDDYFRLNYINPAVESGYLELTYPESPNHPQQKYRLSEKGKALKKKLQKSKRKNKKD